MGFENNQGPEDSHLNGSREQMESLVLDDPLTTTNYRSSMSSLSDATHHPLSPPIVASPADSDPLISPPPYRSSNPPDSSYIDPPSYADVVFSPFDADTVNEINGIESPSKNSDGSPGFSRSASSSSTSGSEYLKITVSNPQKEQEGSNSIVPGSNTYWTYLITTRTNVPDFGGSEFSVSRRFRDVVTLSDRLAESYRGYFIPPRPDKSVVESQVMQKLEFVEQRRVALEKYLRRLATHPVIKKSDELKAFLQAKGKLPLPSSSDVASRMLDGASKLPKQLFGETAVAAPQEVVQPARGGMDLFRMFKELKQSVSVDWGGAKPAVVEEDKEFLEKKEKMNDLEQQLSNASQQVRFIKKIFLLLFFRCCCTTDH